MQINHNNYFNLTLRDVEADSRAIAEINGRMLQLSNRGSESGGIKEQTQKIAEQVFQLQQTINRDLSKIQWAIHNLDPNRDSEVLRSALPILSSISQGLHEMAERSNETKTQLDHALIQSAIDSSQKTLSEAHEKLTRLTVESEEIEEDGFVILPTEVEVNREGVTDETRADFLFARRKTGVIAQRVLSSIFQGLLSPSNWIFSFGRLNNPIPCLVSRYHGTAEVNDQERLKDITSLMKGERVDTQLHAITDNTGMVTDKYGDTIEVPGAFAADITRTDSFRFNGDILFDKSKYDEFNPNEVGRELYRNLGEEGASRVMLICNQAIMPFVLNKHFPKILDGGEWKKMFPERDLTFSQDSGFAFDVEVSDESVHITSKILMRIDTKEDEKFSAHFAVKTEITIPREELCREDIRGEENPFPGLAVKEILSTLIVNNPSEAREVLQKL